MGRGPQWTRWHVCGGTHRSADGLDQTNRCMTRARLTLVLA
ncbi:unnamed protein product [Spirodela intermedia]|uniref:Uncharacterized protein n=1 Tax=Spirodela intermedia TaxID=51605 RepID=A0A7I8K5F9_SPIIN|nr:unnamed protein product [Spirodela intermedia]